MKDIIEIIKNLTDSNLLQLYSVYIQELRDRKIIRTNNIVGDLGVYFAITHYNRTARLPNLIPAPDGTQNIDALSRNGERYSIKATTTNTTGSFVGLYDKDSTEADSQKFEFAVVIVLDDNLKLKNIFELSWKVFLDCKKWDSASSSWKLVVTKELIEKSRIIFEQIDSQHELFSQTAQIIDRNS